MTLFELKREIVTLLSSLEDPYLEARVLLSSLGFSELDQITKKEQEIPIDKVELALEKAKERRDGRPMAYITHEKEFYGLLFYVDENVLIPRPDTEIIVEKAITLYKEKNYSGSILDLCTGSGAIATAISYTLNKDVFFSDISPSALNIAIRNYENLTNRKANARLGDLFEPWKDMKFSLIATNPPYLTPSWYESVSKEVKREPVNALINCGDDGLDIIKKIISSSVNHLEKNGTLLIECDYRQIKDVSLLLRESGFSSIGVEKDLGGRDRVIYGEYKD